MIPTAGSTGSVDAITPGAEHHRGPADQLRVDRGHVAGAAGGDDVPIGDVRQALIVVDDLRIAALHLDDLAEPLEPGARRDRPRTCCVAAAPVGRDPAEHEHPRRQLHRHVDQVLRARRP